MLGWLLLIFIGVPMIELALLIQIGQWIGVWNTITLVILTGILGATMARIQGLGVLAKINRDLSGGAMPSESLFDGVLILIGGIVLLTPGILTDILGFFLLFPWGRKMVKFYLKKKIRETFESGRTIHLRHFDSGHYEDRGEYYEKDCVHGFIPSDGERSRFEGGFSRCPDLDERGPAARKDRAVQR